MAAGITLNKRGESLIKYYEGYSLTPYICPAGYWTIAWGHLISKDDAEKYARGITVAEADALFAIDIKIAEAAVDRFITAPLNANQFAALVSFVFNLGAARLRASTLRKKLNRLDYEGAANEFLKWVWAGGKKLPGLIKRREAELELFNRGNT
jgi:lysozyme